MINLCCCECPFKLGCVDSCSTFDTKQIAAKAGKYILKYKFNGAWLIIESATLSIGDPILFNIRELISDYHYTAVILEPDGEFHDIADNSISYDCLTFAPQLSVTP